MEPKKLYIRLALVVVLFLTAASLMTLKLLDIQVVNGTDVSAGAVAERTVIRTETVDAARGEIYDRNGVKLVSNKTAFAVRFDYFLWDKAKQNQVILDTLQLLNCYDIVYTDTLPISASRPYTFLFTPGDGSSAESRLQNLLKNNDWESDLTAVEVLEKLTELYEIPYDATTAQARQIAGVRYDMDRRGFSSVNPFTLASDVPLEVVTILEEQYASYPGVVVEVGSIRTFETTYAAHILGRTGTIYKEDYEDYKEKGYPMDAIVGRDGMEKALESYLRGTDGSITREVNLSGKVVDIKEHEEAVPGSDCYLTIDLNLQMAAEDSLAKHIARIAAESEAAGEEVEVGGGAAVVVDVSSGEVLALASYPTYNLATFSKDYNDLLTNELKPMINRAIATPYAPGSVFKMVTATAALQSGTITPDTKIKDEGVYRYYAPDYLYHCWYYNDYRMYHGTINVSEALKESCNYFFYEVGRLMGIKTLNDYTTQFGLGQRTGIELEGESMGVMAGPQLREAYGQKWYAGDTLIAAIGQSDNLFTPIQLANYVATIANGGTRYETHLLKTVQNGSSVVYEKTPNAVAEINYTQENLDAVLDGMRKVTEDGTASKVFADYPVAVLGKTGSAQVGGGKANGVFVLAAPADDPEIAVAVIVEHAGSGNNVAWITRDILDAYLGRSTQQ